MTNEEFNQWLVKLKQFLIDNKAEVYWEYVKEDGLLNISHPAYWITHGFRWTHADEGYAYWDRINNLWDEIANK